MSAIGAWASLLGGNKSLADQSDETETDLVPDTFRLQRSEFIRKFQQQNSPQKSAKSSPLKNTNSVQITTSNIDARDLSKLNEREQNQSSPGFDIRPEDAIVNQKIEGKPSSPLTDSGASLRLSPSRFAQSHQSSAQSPPIYGGMVTSNPNPINYTQMGNQSCLSVSDIQDFEDFLADEPFDSLKVAARAPSRNLKKNVDLSSKHSDTRRSSPSRPSCDVAHSPLKLSLKSAVSTHDSLTDAGFLDLR